MINTNPTTDRKPFIKIGERYLNPDHIIEIDPNYRKYFHQDAEFKQVTRVITTAEITSGEDGPFSVTIDYQHDSLAAKAIIAWIESQSETMDIPVEPIILNEDLRQAFQHITDARTELNEMIERTGFDNAAWTQALYAPLDQIEDLKTARPRDAATLGEVFCEHAKDLFDKALEVGLQLTQNDTYPIWKHVDEASHLFESFMLDLDEYSRVNEDGSLIPVYRHELHFNDEMTLCDAINDLDVRFDLYAVAVTGMLIAWIETNEEIDEAKQKAILEAFHPIDHSFNALGTQDIEEDPEPDHDDSITDPTQLKSFDDDSGY